MADRDTSPTSVTSALSHDTAATAKEPASRGSSTASPLMSTPPTSLGDEASILSEAPKVEPARMTQEEVFARMAASAALPTPQSDDAGDAPNSESRRPARSSRKSVTTYNVQILAGTAIHTPTKYLEKHHGNVLHGKLEDVIQVNPTPPKKRAYRPKAASVDIDDPAEQQLVTENAQAQRRTSARVVGDLRRDVFRNLSGAGQAVANTLSAGKQLAQNALRRSASDSRLRASTQTRPLASPKKRPRTARETETPDDAEEEDEKVYNKPKTKQWESHGIWAGQHRDFDPRLSESQNRARRKSQPAKDKFTLPLPMFQTEKFLNGDPRKDFKAFKLPYDTYNPLPRKVKVDGWTKLNKNRFIGDASALWKRDKQDSSQCFCDPEDGCGEACHNRIMAYECDSTNCPLTPEQCGNRPFAQLRKRAKGNRYDYGVEVMETEDKGYGVRAMRTFEPHQIIVEYAGEIITQTECERRMKQVYKRDKCYYLMSFDNKMIIDATRGTIARFVNHSCEPNCEMIKWTVSGEPRMALFAGSRGIMTGEELTYDYNFDPFSSKNIQKCRCGTKGCRGVLGPKPKKPAVDEKFLGSTILAGTKRKLQELYNGSNKASESEAGSPRKRALHNSTLSKERNRLAEEALTRKKAEEEAAAQEAQRASRENRAMKRGGPSTLSRLRKTTHTTASKFKSSRTTTFTIQRKAPLKQRIGRTGILKRTTAAALKGKKPARNIRAPKTPERASSPVSSSEEEEISITPASLRSANKSKKLKQTTLPFAKWRAASAPSSHDSDEDEDMEVPDSEDEDYTAAYKASSSSKPKGKKRTLKAPTARGLHKTGAGVKKVYTAGSSSSGGKVRGAGGRYYKAGK